MNVDNAGPFRTLTQTQAAMRTVKLVRGVNEDMHNIFNPAPITLSLMISMSQLQEDTSADHLQEENGAACDDFITSVDPILEKMRKADENADPSEEINQEGFMGLCDNTDTSADGSQEETVEIVDKADGPRMHS
ncbi:hypothetical protein MMC22_006441 [Lobaria immixta]|nr:hypothetical protein [Lobaria immixta]